MNGTPASVACVGFVVARCPIQNWWREAGTKTEEIACVIIMPGISGALCIAVPGANSVLFHFRNKSQSHKSHPSEARAAVIGDYLIFREVDCREADPHCLIRWERV
jgi:hypothetical protein